MPILEFAALHLPNLFIAGKNCKQLFTQENNRFSNFRNAVKINLFSEKGKFFQSFFSIFFSVSIFFLQGYRGIAQTTVSFTNGGTTPTWTVPAGVYSITVQAWGGGGNGGNTNGNNTATSGGGGGGYASSVLAVIPGQIYNLAIGAGGVTGNAANNGGNSTIALSTNSTLILVRAAGGNGVPATTPGIAPGGTGGTLANSIGTTRFLGGNGSNGATGSTANAGGGGSSAGVTLAGVSATGSTGAIAPTGGGNGGNGRTGSSGNGSAGTAPGGGGGGARRTGGGDRTGGAGARGQIIITYTVCNNLITYPSGGSYCVTNTNSQTPTTSGFTGGAWSATPAGLNINTTTGVINPSSSDPGIYSISNTNKGCAPNAAVTITAIPTTASVTATALSVCGLTSAPLGGNTPTVGTGVWSKVSGTSNIIFSNPSSGSATATLQSPVTYGSYVLRWTISNGSCAVSTEDVTVTFSNPGVTATPGTALAAICQTGTSAALGGTVSAGTGVWSDGGIGGSFSGTNIGTATYTPPPDFSGTVTLTLTATNGTCVDAKSKSLVVNSGPITADAGNDESICANAGAVFIGSTAYFTGTASSFAWTSNGTGFLVDANTLNDATFTASAADIAAGTRNLTLTVSNGACTKTDVKTMTFTPGPTIADMPDASVCSNNSGAFVFSAGATANNFESLTWTTNGTNAIVNPNSLNTAQYTLDPADGASVSFTLTAFGNPGCNDEIKTKVYTITPAPVADAGTAVSMCANQTNFNFTAGANVSFAAGVLWSRSITGDGIINNPNDLTGATYTPSTGDKAAGSVQLTLQAVGNVPCVPATATKILTFLPPPQVNAGPDLAICKNTASIVIGTGATASATTGVLWTSSGTGTFTDANSLTGAIYQPSAADRTAGQITLTLTGNGSSPCAPATDTRLINFTDVPSGTISYPVSAVCITDGLINITSTATPGGVFSASSSDLSINPGNGQVTLSTSKAGTYEITYTLAPLGGCSMFVTTTNLTVTGPLTPSILYNGSPFCTSINSPRQVTLSGGGTGGTYSVTPLGLNLNTATGTVTFPNPGPGGMYEVTYSLPASGGCPAVQAKTDVTISVKPDPKIFYGSGTPYCSDAGNVPVFLKGTTGGTYTVTSSNPINGVLSLNNTTGEINTIESSPGAYTVRYFIEKIPGCNDAIDETSITITPLPIATFSYGASQVCRSNGNIAPTFANGGKAGVFSSIPAGLVFASASTGEINVAASAPGTYTITNTIAAALGCGVVSATGMITITALPVAGFQYSGTPYCNSGVNPLPVFNTGASAGTFTSSTGLDINASTGLVNLAASTPGTYTVTNSFLANGGCPAVSNTSNITITPLPIANISYAGGPYCNTISTPVAVTRTGTGGYTGGTYSVSPTGLTIDANTGSITPFFASVAAPAGGYTVSYTIGAAGGCGVVVTNTTVTILPQGTLTLASGSGNKNQTFCIDLPVTNIIHNLGGGASFASVTGLPAGIAGSFNAGVFTISGTPTVSGTFNYTIIATGNCTPVTATGTLTVQANVTLTLTSDSGPVVQNLCTGIPMVPVKYIVVGNATGVNVTGLPSGVTPIFAAGVLTISGTPSVNGTFNYTITTTGPCINATANGTIRSDAAAPTQPGTVLGSSGLCPPLSGVEYEVPAIAAAAIYNWILPPGWSITSGAGTNKITVTLSGATVFGNNVIEVNAANGCGTSANQLNNIAVDNFASVTIDPVQPVCAGDIINLNAVFGGAAAVSGGVWQVTTGDANVGNIALAATTYTPTAGDIARKFVTFKNTTNSVPGTCPGVDTDIITVDIKPTPTATISVITTPICEGSSTNITITGTPLTTVSYTVNVGATQTVNLDASGTATISTGILTASATYALTQIGYTTGTVCTQTLTAKKDITVIPLVAVDAGANQTVCSNGSITLNGSVNGSANTGIWSAPSGNFGNDKVLNTIYTPSISSGTVLLTLTSADPTLPCTAKTSTMLVTVNPVATVAAGASITICQGSNTNLAGSFGGSASSVTWTGGSGIYSNDNSPVSNYKPDISFSGSETLTITTNDPDGAGGPCTAISASVVVNVNQAPIVSAGPDQTICASGTATLAGSIGGSAPDATWSTSGTGTFDNASIGNAVYTPSNADKAAGFVDLTYKTSKPANVCNAVLSKMKLTLNPVASVVINGVSERIVCQGVKVSLNGVIGGAATSATWNAPTGTFSNTTLSPIYTPTITSGSVDLTLTTNDPDGPAGPCLAQTSTVKVTVNPAPEVPAYLPTLVSSCGMATLDPFPSTIPGVTWYWQADRSSLSTDNNSENPYVITRGDMYYINAQNNTSGCWSLFLDSVDVKTYRIPDPPTFYTSTSPQCAGSSVTLTRSTTLPTNGRFYWQTTPDGTVKDPVNAAVTYNATTSGTYYLRTQSTININCWSAAVPIQVVISTAPVVPGNPASATAQCVTTGTTLSRNGSPAANVTWYWQTVPNGTDTTNASEQNTVFSSGNYYVRARDNDSRCWSLGEGSVTATVYPLPDNPPNPTTNGTQCNTVTLTRNGTIPANTTWFWQTTATGTDVSLSGETRDVTTTGTYYLRARTDAGCWSEGSGQATALFYPLPDEPQMPTSNSPQCADSGVTITRATIIPAGVTWYWQTAADGTNTNANSAVNFTAPTSGTYYLRARTDGTGCWSATAAGLAVTVNPLPDVPTGTFTMSANNTCEDIGVKLTRNGIPAADVDWYWQTVPNGFDEAYKTDTLKSTAVGINYNVWLRAKYTTTGCWSAASHASGNITVRANPLPTLTAAYCEIPGKVRLRATATTPINSYAWFPHVETIQPTTPVYDVDIAQRFTATLGYTNGCSRENFIDVSTNLVVNGDFEANVDYRNPATRSFLTEYVYRSKPLTRATACDAANNTANTSPFFNGPAPIPQCNGDQYLYLRGLWNETVYAVDSNPFDFHQNFGSFSDHTSGTSAGKFLMINGSTSNNAGGQLRTIWEQTVAVEAGKVYYFSGWAANLNGANPARLQFEVNGGLVGTIADLTGIAVGTWVRFYSNPTWTAPFTGNVNIRIRNLNLVAGGNDFGLDDLVFGTLTPAPVTIEGITATTPVCPGETITLAATIKNGLEPFTYEWIGPNSFTSDQLNPTIPNSVANNSGTYTLRVIDGFGCNPPATANSNAVLVLGVGSTPGVERWTGAGNEDWYWCRNWESGTIPTSTDDVTIPAGAVRDVVIDPATSPYDNNLTAKSRNITIEKMLSFGNTGILESEGNLSIANTTGSVIMTVGGEIRLRGNWSNNRGAIGFVPGSADGRVVFRGISQQSINHTALKETFYNLMIDNVAPLINLPALKINVIANTAIDVNGTFDIANGRLQTTSTNLLTVTNPAITSVLGGSNTAFVSGPMERQMNSTNEYYFPVGKLSSPYVNYRPPSVIPKTGNNHRFRAEYFNTTIPSPFNYLDLINGLVKSEWWQIDRMAGTDSAKVKLLYITPSGPADWQGPQPPDNAYSVAIIKNSQTNGTGDWYFTPKYSADSNSGFAVTGPQPESIPWHSQTGMGTPVYSKYMQSFSPFGFGYAYYLILPIRLISFTGTIENKQALLKWTVADNAEVKSFTVEHSTDGVGFAAAGTVPKGNTAVYKFYHNGLVPGSNYYRLLMHGKDGTKIYSNIVVLNYGLITTTITGIKPTLAHDLTYVSVISAKNQPIHIRIFDTRGRLVRTEKALLHQGINTVPVLTRNLANAMYHIHVLTDDGVQANYKIMKE